MKALKKTSWKTSLIGIIGLLVLVAGLVLVYFGKTTFTEVASSLALVGTFLFSIGAFLTKDSDVTGGKRKQ